jgi:MFS transporter, ACS family, glucarate transporter
MLKGHPIPLRNKIAVLIALASGITYLDRVCLSAAAPAMMSALRLTNMQMGYVFSVFSVSYGMFEIPMGSLIDRLGQRKILTRIVACWSIFTALTGVLWGYWWLLAMRFAFGAAEAGAFPALARAIGNWFRVADRGRAIGVMWMGARIGGAIAPPLAALLIGWFGWRIPFAIFGLIGIVWCAVFWCWYRDDPTQHPAATAADLAYALESAAPQRAPGTGTPWNRILWSSNLWALFWMYFATSYGFWFLLTWLPTYLMRQHGMPIGRASVYAALPLGVGSVSCLVGGSLSDRLVRRLGSLRWGRGLVGLCGYLVSAIGFAAAGFMQAPGAAIVCLMLAEVGLDIATPVAWAACLEIGGSFGGTISAFMNVSSCISAFISPIAAAWVYTRFGSFDAMLISAGAVYAVAGLLWLKIDPSQQLHPHFSHDLSAPVAQVSMDERPKI